MNSAKFFKQILDSKQLILIGKMARTIAHEINNPIMIISNNISLLMDDIPEEGLLLKPGSEEFESLQDVLQECERISQITKNLLHFSRPNQMVRQVNSIEPILVRVLKFIEPMVIKTQIQVRMNFLTQNAQCNVNKTEIEHVLMNILDNAIYALNQKYPETSKDPNKKFIEINVSQKKIDVNNELHEYIVVEIFDDGSGMSEDVMNNLFTPFFTTKKAKVMKVSAKKHEGLGLGLTFCKKIIEEHDGFIEVDSKENEFSRISVFIPLYHDSVDIDEEEIVF